MVAAPHRTPLVETFPGPGRLFDLLLLHLYNKELVPC